MLVYLSSWRDQPVPHKRPNDGFWLPFKDETFVEVKTYGRKVSSGPDINAGAEEYERKQREEIIQALSACKGRVGGTDGAAILYS
jgi:hypothetical protein